MQIISYSWRNNLDNNIEVIFEPWGMGFTLQQGSIITVYYGCLDIEHDIHITLAKKYLSIYCSSVEKMKIIIDGQDITSYYSFLDSF